MGDVVSLRPVGETLEFGAMAAVKRDWFLGRLLRVARRLTLLNAHNDGSELNSNFEELDEEITSLQKEYSNELDLIEIMAEVCEAAHNDRQFLERNIQDGQLVTVIASDVDRRRQITLEVQRRGERFLCSDFEIFEITDSGVASMLERYAAA